MAGPTFRSSSSTAGQTASTFSVPKPTGTADGDLLIAFQFTVEGLSGTPPATPTGWTLLDTQGPSGINNNDLKCYYKIASSEPASWTFNNAGGGFGESSVRCICVTTNPTSPPERNVKASGSGTTADAGTITTTNANDLILAAWGFDQGSAYCAAITPDGSYTPLGLLQGAGAESMNTGYKTASSAGAVTNNTATETQTGSPPTPTWFAMAVAISGAITPLTIYPPYPGVPPAVLTM
jgi:hypothetical protein